MLQLNFLSNAILFVPKYRISRYYATIIKIIVIIIIIFIHFIVLYVGIYLFFLSLFFPLPTW
jgi:hypothetical protein